MSASQARRERRAREDAEHRPWGLTCNGIDEVGNGCLMVFARSYRFRTVEQLRLAALGAGWKMAVTRDGRYLDLCPICTERVAKAQEAKRPVDHEGLGDVQPPEIVKT